MSSWSSQKCGSGYKCPSTGAIGPYDTPCAAGTYAGTTTDGTACLTTRDGYYTLRGATTETICPAGYYCTQSESVYPIPCPKGTYGAATGYTSIDNCTKCGAGRTCDHPGLTQELGICDAGFFCASGAWDPRPDSNDAAENATGRLCQAGYYCLEGTPE